MKCDLCGSTASVATYGVYPPQRELSQVPGGQMITTKWSFDPAHFWHQDYCDACVDAARKKSVWHASFLFFLPTVGMMRLWKFSRCTQQEMGDLMAASVHAHRRDPRTKHILWPLGAEGHCSLEDYLTREGAEKRLRKDPRLRAA